MEAGLEGNMGMKQLIERLRQLEAAALAGDPKLLGETTTSMEFINLLVDNSTTLLDRLEKLEAVAELSYTLKHIVDHLPQQDEHFESFLRQTSDKLEDALAVLQEGK